jgi:2-methylcitrate dehydratase PrpD
MVTERIARYISETAYDNLPAEVVQSAKRYIIDCLGVVLAGCIEPGPKILREYVREEGGKQEAGVIGGGFKAPASEAALANGISAHVLDYDDVWIDPYRVHATAPSLPAILAIGEVIGASGKEVLLSYIVNIEIQGCIGLVCGPTHYRIGWHTTGTISSIGATAAAAKLLHLDVEKTRMALGIGASLASGLNSNFGSMTKPFHAGSAARNGVVAALLAQRDFTANASILEAPQGFCRAFGGGAEFDLIPAVNGLGKHYAIVIPGMEMKFYPSCAVTHPTIDAALYLREKYHPQAADIAEIECYTSPLVVWAAHHPHPTTGLEGKFSLGYCIAIALLEGKIARDTFTTDEKLHQPEVQELIHKVKYVQPPEFENAAAAPQKLVIKLKDGKELSHQVDAAKGYTTYPLTWDEICTKYRECASLVLPSEEVERSLDMLSNLETVDNITTLMDILTFKGK